MDLRCDINPGFLAVLYHLRKTWHLEASFFKLLEIYAAIPKLILNEAAHDAHFLTDGIWIFEFSSAFIRSRFVSKTWKKLGWIYIWNFYEDIYFTRNITCP